MKALNEVTKALKMLCLKEGINEFHIIITATAVQALCIAFQPRPTLNSPVSALRNFIFEPRGGCLQGYIEVPFSEKQLSIR